MIRRRQCPAIGDVRSVDFQFAKFLSFVKMLLKGVFRVNAVLQEGNFLRGFLQSLIKMKIGYARVSTFDQNLDLQLRALEKAGCKKIFREKVSSTKRERPQFQRMLDQIRAGDTIVVWKLDRLARSTRSLLETMESIREAGGKFRSLSEPWADTTTHAGKIGWPCLSWRRTSRSREDFLIRQRPPI